MQIYGRLLTKEYECNYIFCLICCRLLQ